MVMANHHWKSFFRNGFISFYWISFFLNEKHISFWNHFNTKKKTSRKRNNKYIDTLAVCKWLERSMKNEQNGTEWNWVELSGVHSFHYLICVFTAVVIHSSSFFRSYTHTRARTLANSLIRSNKMINERMKCVLGRIYALIFNSLPTDCWEDCSVWLDILIFLFYMIRSICVNK